MDLQDIQVLFGTHISLLQQLWLVNKGLRGRQPRKKNSQNIISQTGTPAS